MSSRGFAALLAAASWMGLGAGCGNCEDHEASKLSFELAKFNFDNGKFDQAKVLYSRCVEKCADNYEGWLGLANACREVGNNEFKGAADLAGQGRVQDSKKLFKDGAENHAEAYQLFQLKLKENPDDVAPHYGLGMLYYQRSTSVLPFPFPLDDVVNRQKERNLAIDEFTLVIQKAPRAYQARRYLGLALFAADRMDEGRPHLKIFHDAEQALYERVLNWSGATDEEKLRKETTLKSVNKEIDDIRDVLSEYFMSVQHEFDRLTAKRDRKPEDDLRLAKLKIESLQLENMIKGFHLTNLGEVEQQVRRRCDDYLTVFNRGQITEIMSFVAPSDGRDAAIQKGVQDRIEAGTKFQKPQYRSIVVVGDTASIGLVCDFVTTSGTRLDFELTMHWRLVGGQWKVSDPP